MATRQSQKVEPPKVIGSISKLAGALVGTAVVTGRQIIKTVAQANEQPSGGPRGNSTPTRAGKKKKAAIKTKAKGRKVKKRKKKKVAKRKGTGSPKRGTSIKEASSTVSG